ncbi:MAG TPA: hypothetical protein VFI84_00185 [Candidatus Saccharimonadales bacterium]|nr:hypothetical protein [Candidatus Saccharimonadales bacterium]
MPQSGTSPPHLSPRRLPSGFVRRRTSCRMSDTTGEQYQREHTTEGEYDAEL